MSRHNLNLPREKGTKKNASNNRCILHEPVKHSLIDIFKELKFGRPSASQQYLQECIEYLERFESTL